MENIKGTSQLISQTGLTNGDTIAIVAAFLSFVLGIFTTMITLKINRENKIMNEKLNKNLRSKLSITNIQLLLIDVYGIEAVEALEKVLIQKYKPRWNIQHKNNNRS